MKKVMTICVALALVLGCDDGDPAPYDAGGMVDGGSHVTHPDAGPIDHDACWRLWSTVDCPCSGGLCGPGLVCVDAVCRLPPDAGTGDDADAGDLDGGAP